MPSKANSGKSRKGCARCRERRVKCDGELPECSNCLRRQEKCEYVTWRLTTPAIVNSNHGIHGRSLVPIRYGLSSSVAAPSSPQIERPLELITIKDLMATLHSHTTWGPPGGPDTQFWKNNFVSNARSHDYIYSCLSSLVCLLGETRELPHGQLSTMKAYDEHVAAITSFRKAAVDISKTHWSVILVFGVCVVIFEFGAQQICPDSEFDYLYTFRVLRMSMNVVNTTAPFLKQSALWQYIKDQEIKGPNRLEETLAAIERLEEGVRTSRRTSGNDEDPILGAVEQLRQWTQSVNASPWKWADLIRYPGLVSAAYVDRLAAEDDLALLVFIYWCAIMQLGGAQFERWFFRKWPRRATLAAISKLSEGWSEFLEWPYSIFGIVSTSSTDERAFAETMQSQFSQNEFQFEPQSPRTNYLTSETQRTNVCDVSFLDEYG